MARNFLTPINLNGLELQDASIQGKTTSAIDAITPASGGRIYFDSQTNALKLYNGAAWVSIATGGSTFTLGSTSVAIGATVTTIAGLTLSGPTFSGTIATGLTAGYATINAAGALVSVATIPNSGLTNNTISGKALGTNLDALTISSPLSGSTYNGSGAVTIALAAGYGDTQNPYGTKVANRVLAGPSTGADAVPTFRALVAADIPSLGNITNAGKIGTTADRIITTGADGTLTAATALPNGVTATTQASSNNSTLVATTAYVDTAVFNGQAGFNVHAAVAAATTTNLTGTYTDGVSDQSQGLGIGATFVGTAANIGVIDGVTLVANQRVLIKDQTNKKHNGVYNVTTVSTNITLTRASDFDNSVAGEVFNGDLIYIGGTGGQAGTTWVMNSVGTATTPSGAIKIHGTTGDNINWVQFAGAGTYTGSNGVTVSGTVISGVDATTGAKGVASFTSTQFTVSTGAVSITNLAASVITSGTLLAARGGTGADLSGSTQYGIPYFSAAGVMASTAAGASTQVLIGNAGGAPSWTNISGLSVSSATTATTAGTATVSNTAAFTNDTSSTATTFYPTFVSGSTSPAALTISSTKLSYQPSTGTLTASVIATPSIASAAALDVTTTSNGNITLTPNGTGKIVLGKTTGTADVAGTGNATIVSSNVSITSGNATITSGSAGGSATVGSVSIDVGAASGTSVSLAYGALNLGTTNARVVNIGNATNTTGINLNTINTGGINLTGGSANSSFTSSGQLTFQAGAASVLQLASNQTTGTVTIGAAGGTGTISIGVATGTQTVNVAAGIITTGTKTVNIGTAGTAGTTAVNIGSVGGSTSTTTINGTTVHSGGKTTFAAATTGYGSVNIADGTTPTSGLATGDLWAASGNLLYRSSVGPATKTIAFTDGNIAGSAASLTTSRDIWGQGFNGTANVTGNLTSVGNITGLAANNMIITSATSGNGNLTLNSAGTGTISIASPASTSASTGAVTIQSGSASVGSNLTAGTVTVDTGTKTGTGTAVLNLGTTNAATIGLGNAGSTTTIAGALTIGSGTGFLKVASGVVSAAAIAYTDLPTSSLTGATTTGIARKTTGTLTANSSSTAFSINHQFGQWVTAQLFDTSGNQVEVDVLNASTSNGTTTFTFAVAPTTGTNYQYVIIG